MATVLSMPLKCSDHPDRLVVKKWGRRPHGYTGVCNALGPIYCCSCFFQLVCDPRAQQHHDEGTMTRHYQPKECQLYHDHIPDCWMARVAHHSVPVGQTFYYDCFIEANGLPDEKKMEKEASCHKCKKNNESVTVGPDQFPKLLELEDETGDLENLDLKIWDFPSIQTTLPCLSWMFWV
ncbi:uncharacterized protein FTOL_12411 [Fusarium torulosum]|uniref:Uncharacterized protein n=1 Tax=Fusarium torulosum TaxID=33205 RepID=A0AAE8MJS9_9HYPO|nr:uncharacterized protein FTOL_12411 [Fusarium torulosum]